MKALHFDSIGGASGDMILGALIDLGVDPASLQDQLRSLDVGDFSIVAAETNLQHLRGTQVTVDVPDAPKSHEQNLETISAVVSGSALPEPVKESSLSVFRRLAEAEARVHGTSLEKVHFHEVGAVDSIVDIVGSCLALHLLAASEVTVGPLPVGEGSIETEHGMLPIPVPATAELLKGHPTIRTHETSELITPTGAALLSAWITQFPSSGNTMASAAVGYGFGHRNLQARPNLLRATLSESVNSADNTCLVLECNLDDTVPELLGSLAQSLIEKGALDVFTTPIQMKKQRPGILLTVLAKPEDKDTFLDLIFRETTTFGVREHLASRTVLERRSVEVNTQYGAVRVKVGRWQGKDVTSSPEHDDCVKLAKESDVAVREIYEAAIRNI
jgi:hypothetical protein